MRHIFIINPIAGKSDNTDRLTAMAEGLARRHGLDVECIVTQRPGHATEAVRAIAETGEPVRFYACGGDGTINEVACGVIGLPNAAMTSIPAGTGNDFLKNFGDKAPLFTDAENLWDGPDMELDAIDCNGRCALTIACSGFDAQVADDVHTFSRKLSGQSSYIASVALNFLLRSLNQRWTVTVDGEAATSDFALIAVCNGRYYGGGFMPTSEARMDDSVLHTVLVSKISRVALLRLIGKYAKGQYYLLPQYARCVTAREIIIESPDADILTCLDGEIVRNRRVVLRLSDKKVRFFGPAGCDPNATYQPIPQAAEAL